MIENIRKYRFLIILGLVVVAVALVVGLQSSSVRGSMGGEAYMEIDGRTYSGQDYRQFGINGQELALNLTRSGDYQIGQFLYSLSPASIEYLYRNMQPDSAEQFFINRMLIRQAKKDFGIHPSDEEVSEFTRNMASFAGADREFSPERYQQFIEQGIGRLGMSEKDFLELISDIIATDRIRRLVSAGLDASNEAVAARFALDSQLITGSVARLDVTPFKQALDPTDEDLRKYWELIQDAFMTEEKRSFSYILVAPEMPPTDDTAAEQEATETIAEAAMSEEDKAKAAEEKEAAKTAKEAELAELKRKKQFELDIKIDDFTAVLEMQNGSGFEALAAEEKYGWEIKTTGLFPASAPPEDLQLDLRASGRVGTAVSELFRITPTSDPLSKLSQPLAVGENQWLLARLEKVEAARPKTFDEAKEAVRAQYINEKSREDMEKSINEAAEKISSALKEGKTFVDACIAADLNEIQPFIKVDMRQYQPTTPKEPTNLFSAARIVDPGTLAEPVIENDHAYLIYVAEREIVKEKDFEQLVNEQVDIAISQNMMAAFNDWLQTSSETANIKRFAQ